MMRWQIDRLHVQIVDKSSLEENNEVSVLNHPVWRALTNDLLAHLLENITFTKDFDARVFAEN